MKLKLAPGIPLEIWSWFMSVSTWSYDFLVLNYIAVSWPYLWCHLFSPFFKKYHRGESQLYVIYGIVDSSGCIPPHPPRRFIYGRRTLHPYDILMGFFYLVNGLTPLVSTVMRVDGNAVFHFYIGFGTEVWNLQVPFIYVFTVQLGFATAIQY